MTSDLIFEAVCEACSLDWKAGLTSDQRGRVNVAVKQLRDLYGEAEIAVPDMIQERAEAWRLVYPEIPITPQVITNHWSTILNAAEQARRQQALRESAKRNLANAHAKRNCQTCGDDHFVFVGQDENGYDLTAPCPDCGPSVEAASFWSDRQRHQVIGPEETRRRMWE